MKTKFTLLVAVLVSFNAPAADDLTAVLQQGLFNEEADHDLTAAIKAYQFVVTGADAQRKLAATAVFRLGECYRKLGQTNEAVAQYQRILNDFTDQTNLVTLSRQNLVGLGVPKTSGPLSAGIRNSDMPIGLLEAVLAAKQADAAQMSELVQKMQALNRSELRRVLPTVAPDPLLNRLLEELASAEAKMAELSGTFAPGHPNLKALRDKIAALNTQIDERTAGILEGLKVKGGRAAPTSAQVEAHRLLIERLELEIKTAEADTARYKELIRQKLVPDNSADKVQARLLDLRRQLILARDAGPTGTADDTAAADAPLQNFSPNARAQMKELLQGEIAVASLLLADQRKRVEVGSIPREDTWRFERDVLGLNRQLLAVDGLVNAEDRKRWRDMLVEEIALAEKAVQNERAKLDGGKSIASELAKLQRDVFALKRELVTFDAAPAAGVATARAPLEPVSPVKTDPENAEISRIQALLKDSPDLINAKGTQIGFGAIPSGGGRTMLYQAVMGGWLRAAEFLLDHGADVNSQNPSSRGGNNSDTALHAAVMSGNKAMVKLLIDKGATVDSRDGSNQTPLYVAAGRGFMAIAEQLLDAKADVNAKTYGGTTPLHEAVRQGFRNVVELLAARGADLEAQGNEVRERQEPLRPPFLQGTPLLYAISLDKPAMAELLLASKADPNARNRSGHTPLHYASAFGGTNEVAMLIKAGANVNDKVPTGPRVSWTPLHYAVARGFTSGAAMLLAARADPNAALATGFDNDSQKNYTPLIISASQAPQDVVEMINLLLANKADPNLKTDVGNAPLHRAIMKIKDEQRRVAVARSLVRAGADVNTPDSYGELPLIRAVLLDDKELVGLLLENKANPNARSNEGYTSLHLTAGYQKPKEIIELLLAAKADPNAIDRQGRTALDYVKSDVNLGRSGFPAPSIRVASPTFGNASASSAETPAIKRRSELIDLLRTSGGLDYAPRPEQITLTRRSNGRLMAGLYKGTNDHNRFTLYELIAVAKVDGRAEGWAFPDFSRVTISRLNPKTGKMEDNKLDLDAALKSGDCSRDVPLQWGDLVDVPEAEHGLNEQSHGLTAGFINALAKCLERTVSVTVKGETKKLPLMSQPVVVAKDVSSRAVAYMFSKVDFRLDPVLRSSGLLLTSSDLGRVKVKRRDTATGATNEWTFSLAPTQVTNPTDDLWLRDGDLIEVPEKDTNAALAPATGAVIVPNGSSAQAVPTRPLRRVVPPPEPK